MNGAFRFTYPAPLVGTDREKAEQLRTKIFEIVDGLNIMLDRLEALESRAKGEEEQSG